jgi:hypothetical protein
MEPPSKSLNEKKSGEMGTDLLLDHVGRESCTTIEREQS